jgi:hypothetical protein
MENDLNYFIMDDDLKYSKMKDNLIFFNCKTTSTFLKMEDDLPVGLGRKPCPFLFESE